jgi:hypothetical protein
LRPEVLTGAQANPPIPTQALHNKALVFVADEGADLPGNTLTLADKLLDTLYGDRVHNNDGTHLTGGVDDDGLWQRRWRHMVAYASISYEGPKGQVGKRFLHMLSDEWEGVTDRKWNSERPLIFVLVILQTTQGHQIAAWNAHGPLIRWLPRDIDK